MIQVQMRLNTGERDQGVKDVSLQSKAKKIKLFIGAKKKEDDAVYQQILLIASDGNLKVGRSHWILHRIRTN
jgi:hypothetical protein